MHKRPQHDRTHVRRRANQDEHPSGGEGQDALPRREETGGRQRHAPGVERGRGQSSEKDGADATPGLDTNATWEEEIPEQNKITADAVERMMERQDRERREGRLGADETLFPEGAPQTETHKLAG